MSRPHVAAFSEATMRIVVAVGLGLLVGAGAMLAGGHDPVDAYRVLFEGAFGSHAAFAGTLRVTTPLIFVALAFSIGMRAGVFNAGIQGQFAIATFVCAWLGVKLHIPTPLLIVTILVAAMLAGLAWVLVPLVLRVFFNTNELIPTFLLNYVALLVVQYLIVSKFSDPLFNGTTNGTPEIADGARLFDIMPPYGVTIALPVIVVVAVILAFALKRTVAGYRLEMTGRSLRFATYGGIRTRRVTAASLAFSAMLAGAAAVPVVLGIQHRAVAGMNANLMFDGIVVSLIARNNPIAILPAALFLGGLENSGIALQLGTDIPLSMVTVITGTIILFITVQRGGVPSLVSRFTRRQEEGSGSGGGIGAHDPARDVPPQPASSVAAGGRPEIGQDRG